MKELDFEKRRTDSLLYQMIPRSVADRLRQGEPALNTCEVFAIFNLKLPPEILKQCVTNKYYYYSANGHAAHIWSKC